MTALHHLAFKNGSIAYKIVKSSRRKTSELFVDSSSVLIRTPASKSAKEIEGLIKAKADWIVKKQEEHRRASSYSTNPTFKDGSKLPYLGALYTLSIIVDSNFTTEKIRFANNEFIVTLPSKSAGKVKQLYYNWLHEKAQVILADKVRHYAHLVNVKPNRIVIKKIKQRWGSATRSNILNFNVNLLKVPEDILDYIVLHEVCHLKIRDHSPRFWGLVRNHMPRFAERRSYLGMMDHGGLHLAD